MNKIALSKWFSFLFLLMIFSKIAYAEQQSSITQYGITWYFDGQYECGQFITGDWWVVGPVTVTHTDPEQIPGRNGSVIDVKPGKYHGWDDRASNYDENLRVKFPVTINGMNSLSSTISIPEPNCVTSAKKNGFMSRFNLCSVTNTQTLAVLTIVESPVPEGSFRPSYLGGEYKEIINISDADFNVLPRLPVQSTSTDIELLIDFIERPWLDHFNSWTTQYNYAADNNRGYGRDMSDQISEIAIALMQDIPQLELMATLMIQRGIDVYQAIHNGAIFPADGGHASGRKWPVLFAGRLLNHQGMLSIGEDFPVSTFGEDCQTYYTADGQPWWGIRHCTEPNRDDQALDSYRVCCSSKTWVGQMLAALVLGLREEWNHEAYFDYVDRWIDEGGSFGGINKGYVEEFWNTYRNNLPPEKIHSANSAADTEAPSVPNGLMAGSITGSTLMLSWNAATDNVLVVAYDIYIDSKFYQSVNSATISINNLKCNTSYEFKVQARDAAGNKSSFSDLYNESTSSVCDPVQVAGSVSRDYWTDISGNNIADLTGNENYPGNPTGSDELTSLEAVDWDNPLITSGWGENYGQRIRGYLIPELSGDYTFWIASDNSSEFYLSIDDNPSNMIKIAYVEGSTSQYSWARYSSQKSMPVSLQEGVRYYLEILHKDGCCGDHLAVGWSKPGEESSAPSEVVPGYVLAPLPYQSSKNVTGIEVNPTTLTLNTGQSSKLSITVGPSDATDKSATWSSDDTSVATVDANGLVTAIAQGTAIISATSNDGGFTDKCTVSVANISTGSKTKGYGAENSGFIIRPNIVSHGNVEIILEGYRDIAEIIIFDISGKEVFKNLAAFCTNKGIATIKVPVDDLKHKGIYFVVASDGQSIQQQKLIIY